jgi:hypothetical protein
MFAVLRRWPPAKRNLALLPAKTVYLEKSIERVIGRTLSAQGKLFGTPPTSLPYTGQDMDGWLVKQKVSMNLWTQ